MKYYSNFISGLQSLIPEILLAYDKSAHISAVYDGLIMYESNIHTSEIKSYKFFNNTFLLISHTKQASINSLLSWAIKNEQFTRVVKEFFRGRRSKIRIVLSEENQTVSGNKELLKKVERRLVQQCRLLIDKSLPDFEIWFYKRKEGDRFIGIRLTRHTDYKKTLMKGELRPELTFVMNYLSDPEPTDTFLDPFCGSGAIAFQRAAAFPYHKIIAADKNVSNAELAFRNQDKRSNFEILQLDGTTLNTIPNASIDVLVTDPPWGIFKELYDLGTFYNSFITAAIRVLKPNGRLVVLSAQKELVTQIIEKNSTSLKLINRYDILVSGKKSGLFKIQKLS